jgi:catechol 2,3-dioxygenase-like lactoylglutathione lyase family enzyme
MSEGIQIIGIYVRDQDEAHDFYVGKLDFRVRTDQRNGGYRWLTVQHPSQPEFQLGLFRPQSPLQDASTAEALCALVAKGAMPPLVLAVADCHAAYAHLAARGVEFTQEPVARYGNIDANFRDPSGNGWKMIQTGARAGNSPRQSGSKQRSRRCFEPFSVWTRISPSKADQGLRSLATRPKVIERRKVFASSVRTCISKGRLKYFQVGGLIRILEPAMSDFKAASMAAQKEGW